MKALFCALAIPLLAACSKQDATPPIAAAATAAPETTPPAATPPKKLLVLATFAPIYCFTKNVAGDLADVEMIAPPGTPAAMFQPAPADVTRIMQADIIIENGFGFESWMDNLVARGLKPGAIRVIAARGAGPGIPGLPGDPTSPPGDAPSDDSAPPDPHVWLDPVMAIKEVQNVRDALMARDPSHATDYLTNENRYEAALRDLDDQVGTQTVDLQKRRIACTDSTVFYFLKRYEFIPVDLRKTGKPGPHTADALLATTQADLLNASPLPVVRADPMESGSASTDFYETTTLANVAALREALGAQPAPDGSPSGPLK
jgi:zinc transport system substrate-binding protein